MMCSKSAFLAPMVLEHTSATTDARPAYPSHVCPVDPGAGINTRAGISRYRVLDVHGKAVKLKSDLLTLFRPSGYPTTFDVNAEVSNCERLPKKRLNLAEGKKRARALLFRSWVKGGREPGEAYP